METLKGLILSGGAGTRLRPITHTSAKQLVPVANKPVLFYGIEALVEAGDHRDRDRDRARDRRRDPRGRRRRLRVRGSRSPTSSRTRRAGSPTRCSPPRSSSAAAPFVMYLGDNLLRDGITELVDAFRDDEPDALILLTRSPTRGTTASPSSTATASSAWSRSRRSRRRTWRSSASTCSGPKIFDAARAIEPSGRGELEITDAIQHLIDNGSQVESTPSSGWWKDTGQLADMLEANRLVLEDLERRDRGRARSSPGSRAGRDRGRRGARALAGARPGDHRRRSARSSTPTSARTPRSAPACTIERSEVEHSILLAGCDRRPTSRSRMEASLLGRNVKLTRGDGHAEGAADDRRRQLGDRDPLRVAGRRRRRDARPATWSTPARAAVTRSSRSAAPSSTSPMRPMCRGGDRRDPPGRGHQLRRLDRRRRRRGRRGGRDARQRHRRRRCSPAPPRAHRRQGRLRLQRLRLRRRASAALRRVRPHPPDLRLRPLEAGRRDLGRGRQSAPLHRPLVVALRHRAATTSSRRCCASPASSRR